MGSGFDINDVIAQITTKGRLRAARCAMAQALLSDDECEAREILARALGLDPADHETLTIAESIARGER